MTRAIPTVIVPGIILDAAVCLLLQVTCGVHCVHLSACSRAWVWYGLGDNIGTNPINRHMTAHHHGQRFTDTMSSQQRSEEQKTLILKLADERQPHIIEPIIHDELLRWCNEENIEYRKMESLPCYKWCGLQGIKRMERHAMSRATTDQYQDLVKLLKEHLSGVSAVSLTTDAGMNHGDCYIALTVHWLDEQFLMQHAVLDVIPTMNTRHTKLNLSAISKSAIDSWLVKHKLHALISDSAKNFTSAAKSLEEDGSIADAQRCAIHTIQLVIKDSLAASSQLFKLIAKGQSISRYWKNTKASQQYRELQLFNTSVVASRQW